jgi:hypothetical protein
MQGRRGEGGEGKTDREWRQDGSARSYDNHVAFYSTLLPFLLLAPSRVRSSLLARDRQIDSLTVGQPPGRRPTTTSAPNATPPPGHRRRLSYSSIRSPLVVPSRAPSPGPSSTARRPKPPFIRSFPAIRVIKQQPPVRQTHPCTAAVSSISSIRGSHPPLALPTITGGNPTPSRCRRPRRRARHCCVRITCLGRGRYNTQ